VRALAFYLPQFHPIPENDQWWGAGFTEWTNVTRARPLVRGHAQPRLPANLGFYDLRVPDVRAAQAALAATYGIDGFCYYHYWFGGRRLLERPFEDVLRSGEPDFPFCLCWANENWTSVWNGGDRQVLVHQRYSPADDLAHIRWLSRAFADSRYMKVDGRPLFLVYRPTDLPDPQRTADAWRAEAVRLGVGEPYLCAVQAFAADRVDPRMLGFDAAVRFAPDWIALGPSARSGVVWRAARKAFHPQSPYRRHRFCDYESAAQGWLDNAKSGYPQFPCVAPGFDNSPRRPVHDATVLLDSTPERYERWVRAVLDRFDPPGFDEDLLFVNSWNEWAEGSQLEPCQHWGLGYLEAHARAMRGQRAEASSSIAPRSIAPQSTSPVGAGMKETSSGP
jgi:hypothetical protein